MKKVLKILGITAAVAALIGSAVLLKKKRKTVKSGPETGSGRSGRRRK